MGWRPNYQRATAIRLAILRVIIGWSAPQTRREKPTFVRCAYRREPVDAPERVCRSPTVYANHPTTVRHVGIASLTTGWRVTASDPRRMM